MGTSLFAWGDNSSGQLGRSDIEAVASPQAVERATDGRQVTSLSAGCGHVLALLEDGTVMGWGRNVFGQAGGGRPGGVVPPTPVPGLTDVVAVAAGGGHSIALRSDGRVWGWGAGFFGMLGSIGDQVHPVPQPIAGVEGIVAVAAGGSHNLARTQDGQVLMWGRDDHGQLADPQQRHADGRRVVEFAGTSFSCRFAPAPVDGIGRVTSMAAGGGHCMVVDADGRLLTWGFNDRGQLGHGDDAASAVPRPVDGLTGVTSLGAGYHHSVAVADGGQVFAWGLNDGGQVGDGSREDRTTPSPVRGLPAVRSVDANGGGSDIRPGNAGHSLALDTDGGVWEWGFVVDADGPVGAVRRVPQPRRVPAPERVVAVHAGGEIPDMSRRATEGEYAEEPTGAFSFLQVDGGGQR